MLTTHPPLRLNEAQMTMLELFQHRQMSADELESLKNTLVRHLTHELDHEIEQVMKDKNLTPADIAKHTDAMNENRTEYKKKARLRK